MGMFENAAKILGLSSKATLPIHSGTVGSIDSSRGWLPIIREAFAGAWQRNIEIDVDTVLSYSADFACRTLIASDIAKMALRLVKLNEHGNWVPTTNPAYSPVLRRPNHYQNRIQFLENWVLSKLQTGNTFILKVRDNRNVVIKLYILDPRRVQVLVSTSGDVFYQLSTDELSGLTAGQVTVPASEIIHDRFNCMFHPLVGVSPIFASGIAAMQGIAIQQQSTHFFQNNASPGGVLTAAGAIGDETAARLKAYWEENYTGKNRGKIAVLGDGLKFEAMTAKASDSQLIEQLKWTAEVVCSTYHVPPYKIGVGAMPSYNNIQSLNVEYYSQCLQVLIESIELCLDEGLGMAEGMGTEFDLDNLLRMDTTTQMQALEAGKNYLTPDEGRKRINLDPVEGGSVVYRQQQDFSLAALAKRDAQADPFAKSGDTASTADSAVANDNNLQSEARAALLEITKGFR